MVVAQNCDQHGFRLWLVAWLNQAITWTNVDLSSMRSSDIHLKAISQKTSQPTIIKIWKLLIKEKDPNLPGASELMNRFSWENSLVLCKSDISISMA